MDFPLLDIRNSETKGRVWSFGETTEFFMANMPYFTSLNKKLLLFKMSLINVKVFPTASQGLGVCNH